MPRGPGRKPKEFTGVVFTFDVPREHRAFLFSEYNESYPADYTGENKPTSLEFFKSGYLAAMNDTIGPKLQELKTVEARKQLVEIEANEAQEEKDRLAKIKAEETAKAEQSATKARLRAYLETVDD